METRFVASNLPGTDPTPATKSMSPREVGVVAGLVSVIVPTFNRAYCLEKTLLSALRQTYPHLEVIVVDDGSTDGTEALVERCFGHDTRIRYLRQANTGVSGARNHGMRAARGEFIAFLDSDDLWHPEKLRLQLEVLRLFPDAGMVWTDMCAVDEHGRVVSERYLKHMYSTYRYYPRPEDLFDRRRELGTRDTLFWKRGQGGPAPRAYAGKVFSKMVLGSLVHTSTVLLRRERWQAVRTFREDLRYCGEDFDFHLRTCREGVVAFLDLPTIVYQKGRPDQLTRPEYKVYSAMNFLKTVEPVLAREGGRLDVRKDLVREVLSDGHGWLGYRLMEAGERRQAALHLARSLWLKPTPRMAGYLALTMVPAETADRVRTRYRSVKACVSKLLVSSGEAAGGRARAPIPVRSAA